MADAAENEEDEKKESCSFIFLYFPNRDKVNKITEPHSRRRMTMKRNKLYGVVIRTLLTPPSCCAKSVDGGRAPVD